MGLFYSCLEKLSHPKKPIEPRKSPFKRIFLVQDRHGGNFCEDTVAYYTIPYLDEL